MAERLATMLRLTLILLAIGCISAKKFSIMAPNVFHIGVKEQVSIAVFGSGPPVNVKLYLQSYPHKLKKFSEVQGRVDQGGHIFLPVKVEPENLPDTASVDKQYVYLVAESDDAHFQFHKEAKILLSYKDGMVFIQTDKPIYTPKQKVNIRIIPVEFDMKPSRRKITVVVENPQGIRVQQWKDLDTSTGIISQKFDLGDFVLMGNWTITALYGHRDIHNTSVKFEVKEYVLPKFSVKLSVPDYILKTDDKIRINITTRYSYGKAVRGSALVYLNIAGNNGQIVLFSRPNILLDKSGVTTYTEKVQTIKELPGKLWFPEKSRLQVQVDVIERATGTKESAVDSSCQFTSSPYFVQFIKTPNYYKPGFTFPVKVLVTHPNKQPARNVRVLIQVKVTRNGVMEVRQKFDRDNVKARASTDEHGEAHFVLDSCSNCQLITLKVKTDDDRLEDKQNGVAFKMIKPFKPENGQFVMVRQLKTGKVGQKMDCELFRSRKDGAIKLSFAIVSRGRILSHNTTDSLDGSGSKSWSFLVTPQMSPSARLIGYYFDNNGRVVADSILLNVEDSLPTTVDFPDAHVQAGASSVQLNQIKKIPGTHYNIKIKAPEGTRLGLLAVDESVYLLRNKNRLTKERIFKTAEKLDLGCGEGGGKDSIDIFKNAGVVLMTDDFVSDGRGDYGCSEDESRKKRSIRDTLGLENKTCCEMAADNGNVTCAKLTDSLKGLSPHCRETFFKCCTKLHGMEDTALLGRSFGLGPDLGFGDGPDENVMDQTQVRSHFPETWIYDEKVVGSSGEYELPVTIPHTITTWVMQAVAINNQTGLGLATPLRIVGDLPYFVTLKMPYSVKRGEQVSLLATVFNYYMEKITARIYLKGDKDFCSIAADGELAMIGTVDVPPNDAKSVAVPIVPKIIGKVGVEVWAFLPIQLGSSADAVRKTLYVLPEGKEHRESQSFVLDPSGNLDDEPKSGNPIQSGLQSHVIDLKIPNLDKAIPNSVGAIVYISGNLVGPVVNTTIEGGLEEFFRQPTGCGEQNMIYLAPNVYVLEYLMNTGQLTGANEENAYRFIQSGYARELNYRRDDKSFSAFGSSRPGSTWLTAFVMRVFCKIQEFPGMDIIDEELVCDSVNWLVQNQRADGALPEINAVIHREMVGGVYTEGDVSMTAFVLSTLAECKCKGVQNTQEAIRGAKGFLERKYKTLNKPYSMALTAYALSLVNSTEKLKANDRLVQNAVYDSAKKSRRWDAGGNALNVETAGYALLTQIILGRTGYAGPIVTYLTNQRKGGVGFVSTQDTVVALQALALYSEETAGKTLDLKVKLESQTNRKWKPGEIHITPENALLRRKQDVTRFLGGKLFVDTRGTGAGLLEVEIRYNLPSSRNETCKFDLKKTVKEIKDNNKAEEVLGPRQNDAVAENKGKNEKKGCKGKNKHTKRCRDKKKPAKHEPVKSISLKVCTRYREQGNTSMAIMDIGILTGFKPDPESLKNLQTNLPELDKVEVSDTSLVIYLSEIPSNRELCVDVQFDREYYVGVVQAVPVNVYDYYEPDESCSVFYGPDKFSPLNLGVCDVGSASCKCTQDECAQHDPALKNIAKLINMACAGNYHYIVKGRVLFVDEKDKMVEYVVKIKEIIKQGNKELQVKQKISFWKRGTCASPDLKERKEYLFMGQDDKGGRYELDKTSFVKLWPKRPAGHKDKLILDGFAKQFSSC